MTSQQTCSSCKSCVHLVSDSTILTKESILSQMVCVFCWVPLSSKNSLDLAPLASGCGHLFHRSCLEYRREMYTNSPTRCPLCGFIISTLVSVHILEQESRRNGSRESKEETKRKVLYQIDELKEEIGRL